MPDLCLDHLSLYELSALDLIHIASDIGFGAVSLFIKPLPLGPYRDLISDAAARRDVLTALRLHNMRVGVIEPFMLDDAIDWEIFKRSADLTAEIGGRINALGFDSDPNRLRESMFHLAEVATAAGVAMTIEAFPASSVRTQSQALDLAIAGGAHVGLCVDVLHVRRAGDDWRAIADLPSERIFHMQLSDGLLAEPADRMQEATTARLAPGLGEFDLPALIPFIPLHTCVAAEAPFGVAAGLDPPLRARTLFDATRRLLKNGAQ